MCEAVSMYYDLEVRCTNCFHREVIKLPRGSRLEEIETKCRHCGCNALDRDYDRLREGRYSEKMGKLPYD